jgi:uncharacterized cupin superfamily protein
MNFNVKSTVIAFTLALTVSAAPLAPASGCPAGTVTAVSNFAGQSQVDTVCVQPNTCYADSAGNCAGQDGTYACAPNGWCCTGTDLRLTNQLNGNVCVNPDVGKANQERSPSDAAITSRDTTATCPPGTVTADSNFAGQSQVDTVCVQPNTCYADSAGNCAGQDGTYACAPNGWCCTGTDLRLTNQLNGNVCVSPDVGKANQETSSSNADRASDKE